MPNLHQATFASIIAITSVIAGTGTGSAQQAQTPHPFKSASISWNPEGGTNSVPPEIKVGHDGSRYTHLEGKLETRFKIKAEVKSRYRLFGFVLATTDPTNLTSQVDEKIRLTAEKHVGAVESLGAQNRTIDRNVFFSLDAANAHNGFSFEQEVVDMCNDEHPELPSEKTTVNSGGITVFVGYSAHKKRDLIEVPGIAIWDFSTHSRPAIAFTTIPFNVVCTGKLAPRSAGLPPPRAKAKPVSVDLRVDQHGETCPKNATVKAYADYKSATTATMRMLRMGNRLGKVKKVKTRKVEAFGKVWHRAEAEFEYTMDPGEKTFRLRVDGVADKAQTVTIDCPPFEVTSAWLKYEVQDTHACPKKIVETATFKTTRPGWVDYEIKHQIGATVWEDRLTAKRIGKEYVATHVREFAIGKLDSLYMADVKNRPANSGWVRLKVDCMKVSGGDITFTDANGPSCPRKATALINIETDLEGPVPYELSCSGGRTWKRTATAQNMQNGHIVALDVLPLTISKTERISCELHSKVNGQMRSLKVKHHTYQCITPKFETPTDDIATRPGSNQTAPQVDNVISLPARIIPPRKARPVCEGGKLLKASSSPSGYRCACSKNRRVKTISGGWRCAALPAFKKAKKRKADTKKAGNKKVIKRAPKRAAVKPLCKGGTVRSGKCVCGKNLKPVKGICPAGTAKTLFKAKSKKKPAAAVRRNAPARKKQVGKSKKMKLLLPDAQQVR
jgi:hypothetical protein